MRVLVTGHAGYIGAVVVPTLISNGHQVTGLDTFFFENCGWNDEMVSIPAVCKDIRNVVREDLTGFDAVVHLAALSNDPLGDLKREWTNEINYLASVRLARLAKEAGVQRFVYASSCSMYGASSSEDLLTEDAPLRPITPYAESKVRTEQALGELADSGFSPILMRNATAYGVSPYLRMDLVLNNLTGWAYTTGKIRIMSDGTPWRPIVHIRDIALACATLLAAPRSAIHNQAFNIGSNSENYQVRELAEIVRETIPNCSIEYAGDSKPDPRSYRVDFSKIARSIPSFKPTWNARLGAQELFDAFHKAQLALADFQGRKYIRLAELKYLLDTNRLDQMLFWRT
jgi:nucleoside-diphosphate-sugar epimerase